MMKQTKISQLLLMFLENKIMDAMGKEHSETRK